MSTAKPTEPDTKNSSETESHPANDRQTEHVTSSSNEDHPLEAEREDRHSSQPQAQISHTSEQTSNPVKDDKRLVSSSNDSLPRGNSSLSYNSPPPSHVATAQNIFSGKSGAGMMCSNLRSNPFSIGSDQASSSAAILARPKFSLKPSQFGGAKGDSSSASANASSSMPGTGSSSPFIRPAKLNYDSDDAESSNADSSTSNRPVLSGDRADVVAETTTRNDNGVTVSQNGSISKDEVPSTSANISRANTETFGSFGQNLATFSDASSSSFVFGEKLDDRVTNVTRENGATNGHASEADKPRIQTVEEAVVEYKKQQEIGPTLPEVETVTGEEDESNVLQMNCKLFLLHEKERSWAEKGRGCLRLNDTESGSQSRMVMRTVGIHRVILNTNIWSNMLCERANPRSLRITGTDGETDGIHVYLITGASSDIDHLFNALSYRIQHIKHSQSSTAAENESTATNKRKPSDDDTDQSELSPKKTRTEEEDSLVNS